MPGPDDTRQTATTLLPLPRWASRLLGAPGAVSFRRFDSLVRRAAELETGVRALHDAALASSARSSAVRGLRPAGARRLGDDASLFLAAAREATRRTIGLRAFDEQLLACCALLSGHAVELDTGEGKTLVGALAAAGHALAGRRAHVLSVNDYLAQRDAEWMHPLFELLGVSVGWVGQHTPHDERRRAYGCRVVYAPVSEIGFDVLRDRFAVADAERVGPAFDVAIVDEADAVMIDEAMVPLVLAGSSPDESDDLVEATLLVEGLTAGAHFDVDGDEATVTLTDAGLDLLEASLGGINLYDAEHVELLTRINLALHARVLVHRDEEYIVDEGIVRLVNTGRGRIAHLQRWRDGLHAAVEAKERVTATAPGIVLDSITIQDLLASYRTLSGMSGTIVAVAEELLEFYTLASGRVERHEPNRRVDPPDRVTVDEAEKLRAVVAEVLTRHEAGQPVLVGTQSIAESEHVAGLLRDAGVRARVLNAKNDADEASVVARAGEFAAVTISTQMSGRGTDIRLGGADEGDRERVVAAGGLAVVAVGRYPTGRLDRQLRGRAARQGDPGTSVAFASLDDDLVRTHAPAHHLARIERDGAQLPMERRRKIVDAAQRIAEGVRRDRHRATWQYSRAIAAQREAVLARRARLVAGEDAGVVLDGRLAAPGPLAAGVEPAVVARLVRGTALHFLDERWTEHLARLQEIRDGIHLRALAGQKPADEFHRIALREFAGFFDAAADDAATFLAGLAPEDAARGLDELGLRRPSATWTYMVSDDPLGAPGDRGVRRLGGIVRSRVFRIE